jgi:hypothetical protein
VYDSIGEGAACHINWAASEALGHPFSISPQSSASSSAKCAYFVPFAQIGLKTDSLVISWLAW